MSVHFTGMCLIGVYLTGVHLIGVPHKRASGIRLPNIMNIPNPHHEQNAAFYLVVRTYGAKCALVLLSQSATAPVTCRGPTPYLGNFHFSTSEVPPSGPL